MRMRTIDAIYHLILHDQHISSAEIESRLIELGFEMPSLLLISSTKSKVLHLLKLLENAGVIDPGLSVPLPRELRRKGRRRLT